MKAVKIKKNGGPEVLDVEEITLRKPIKNEVLIEHAAIGLELYRHIPQIWTLSFNVA